MTARPKYLGDFDTYWDKKAKEEQSIDMTYFQNPDDPDNILMGRSDGSALLTYPTYQGLGSIQDETAFDFDASIKAHNANNPAFSLSDVSANNLSNLDDLYDPSVYKFNVGQIKTGKDIDETYDTTGNVIENVSVGQNYTKVNLMDLAIKNLDFDVGPSSDDGVFGGKITFSSIDSQQFKPDIHGKPTKDKRVVKKKKPGKLKKFFGKIKSKWGELTEIEQALISKQIGDALGNVGTPLTQGTSQGPGAFNTGSMYKGDYA